MVKRQGVHLSMQKICFCLQDPIYHTSLESQWSMQSGKSRKQGAVINQRDHTEGSTVRADVTNKADFKILYASKHTSL